MRLALTSTPERNAALAAMARRRGLEPVHLPCIRIEELPVDTAGIRDRAAHSDALVVTSSTTVSILAERGILADRTVFAVGRATAERARAAGASIAWAGSGGVHRLGAEAAELLRGRRILVAGAANSLAEVSGVLREVGASVSAVAVYATAPISPSDAPVDAVAFGSPSAVAGWLSSRTLDGVVVGAIGTTTAGALTRAGVAVDAVPPHPDFGGLIEQMAALRPERSTT